MHQESKLSEQGLTGGYEMIEFSRGLIYLLLALGVPLAAWLSSGGVKHLREQLNKYYKKYFPGKSKEMDKIPDNVLVDIVKNQPKST